MHDVSLGIGALSGENMYFHNMRKKNIWDMG